MIILSIPYTRMGVPVGITMNQVRFLKIVAIVTSIGAYLMLLMGAIVTKTGAGKGCGNSWPFCQGQLIPASLPLETVLEYSHRLISGGVGCLILLLAIWSCRRYKTDRRVKILSCMSLFFVVLQGALGAMTVVFAGNLARKTVLALHFGFSLLSFASVILLACYLFQISADKPPLPQRVVVPRGMRYAIWGLAVYTYIVVYTGALVRHTKATMGCGYSFPGCGETYFPNFSSLAGIHMLHRYASLSLLLLVAWLLIVVIRHQQTYPDLLRGSQLAFLLILLQALSGITTVFMGGQVLVTLVHTTIIAVFFTVLSYLCMQVGLPWKQAREMK
jgi:heme a synthase